MAKRSQFPPTVVAPLPKHLGRRPLDVPPEYSTSLPEAFKDHPFVAGQFFLTLPPGLVVLLEKHVGDPVLSPDLRPLEMGGGRICRERCGNAGFWNGQLIKHEDLEESEPIPKVSGEESLDFGERKQAIKANATRKIFNQRDSWLYKMARGYAGWLVTNPQFLNEQDQLLATWRTQIQRWGVAGRGQVPMGGHPRASSDVDTFGFDDLKRFDEALIGFLIRWQLDELSAPDLPQPIKPILSGQIAHATIAHRDRYGGIFQLPAIYPVPTREELRNLLSDIRTARGDNEHLAGWLAIIRKDNTAKNQIDRYARIRTLVHYWAILHVRHRAQLDRKVNKLQQAFAEYLGAKAHSIKKDLEFVTKRLGAHWELRDASAFLRRKSTWKTSHALIEGAELQSPVIHLCTAHSVVAK